jgi:hypothetical protein
MKNQRSSAARQAAQKPAVADEAQTAEYISDLLQQLERLACTHGLARLQYLLMECREEAQKIAASG